jgi:hypothetical protein
MLRQIGELSRADQAYIVDLWDKFGLTPFAAGQPREAVHDIGKDADTGSLSDTEAELQRAKATIARLREAGKRAVAQRDQWETRAKELERVVANLRRQSGNAEDKFERAKKVFPKLFIQTLQSAAVPWRPWCAARSSKNFGRSSRLSNRGAQRSSRIGLAALNRSRAIVF